MTRTPLVYIGLCIFLVAVIRENSIAQNPHRAIDSLTTLLRTDTHRNDIELMCKLSALHVFNKDNAKAWLLYQKALRIAKNSRSKLDMATVYCIKAGLYESQNEVDSAVLYYTKGAKGYRFMQDKRRLASVYSDISLLYRKKGDCRQALNWAIAAQRISKEVAERPKERFCYIGELYQCLGKIDSAEYYFQSCLNFRKEFGQHKKAFYAFFFLENIYHDTQRYDKQFELIKQREAYSRAYLDSFSLAKTLHTKAIFLQFLNDSSSLSAFYNALEIAEQSKNYDVQARCLIGIGEIYLDHSRTDHAISLLDKSVEIAKKHKLLCTQTYAQMALSKGHLELKDYLTAHDHIVTAIVLNDSSNHERTRPYLFYSLSDLYLKIGTPKTALEAIEDGILASRKNRDLPVEIELKHLKVEAYLQMKKDGVRSLIDSLQQLTDSMNTRHFDLLLYKTLYAWAESNGDYKRANSYLQKVVELEKQIANKELENQAEKLSVVYNFEKQEAENRRLRKDKKGQETIIRQQQYVLSTGILILLLILILSLVLYFSNIKHKRARLLLRSQNKKIQKLNDSKDQVFSIIAHDLRGPIANIISFSELLHQALRSKETETIQLASEIIDQQSKATLNTLDNLLQWARGQQNTIRVTQEMGRIYPIGESLRGFFRTRFLDKELSFNNLIPEDTTAYFDSSMIEVVLRNLLSNAIKFTPQGGEITLRAMELPSVIKIELSDSGVGISEDRIDKIFDPQYHESTIGTDAEEGTGLGLKICQDFIRRNRGTIGVKSTFGEGSTFYFTLPLHSKN